MAAMTLLPTTDHHSHHRRRRRKKPPALAPPQQQPVPQPSISSWEQFKNLLSCRSTASVHVIPPSKPTIASRHVSGVCGSSLCAFRNVVHGNTRVEHRSDSTDTVSVDSIANSSTYKETAPLTRPVRRRRSGHPPPAEAVVVAGKGGGMPLRGLSGCVECRAVSVEPMSRRYPRPRALCACPDCGEVFTKAESLEHHQAIRHAVSELGPEDSGRNIVEIIFKSSWQHQQGPRGTPYHNRLICHVDRILKVHNSPRTLSRFESHRAAVKSRHAAPSSARAAADGNELLRFLPAAIACTLGAGGSTSLCASPCCGICSAIRHGFSSSGVRTTASSGRAHAAAGGGGEVRAMLVCRVIAGRVRRAEGDSAVGDDSPATAVAEEPFDSVSSDGNLEELFVVNPRAILPCFVVVYRMID